VDIPVHITDQDSEKINFSTYLNKRKDSLLYIANYYFKHMV